MKAILEVEFSKDSIVDEANLWAEYGGDWHKRIESFMDSDGLGIFNVDDIKLVRVEE